MLLEARPRPASNRFTPPNHAVHLLPTLPDTLPNLALLSLTFPASFFGCPRAQKHCRPCRPCRSPLPPLARWNHFFRHVDVHPENVNFLDGNAADLDRECLRYEKRIAAVGGIDLIFTGTGPDGEIGRNEPGSSLASLTRPKTLAYETLIKLEEKWEEAGLFVAGGGIGSSFSPSSSSSSAAAAADVDAAPTPKVALTMGIHTFMSCKEALVLFCGVSRARALSKSVEDGVNHMFPVSVLQRNPKTVFICDEGATMELRVKTVRYFKGLQETVLRSWVRLEGDGTGAAAPQTGEEEEEMKRSLSSVAAATGLSSGSPNKRPRISTAAAGGGGGGGSGTISSPSMRVPMPLDSKPASR